MGKKTIAFKDEFTFEERCQESQDIIAKYPDRVPINNYKNMKNQSPPWNKSLSSLLEQYQKTVGENQKLTSTMIDEMGARLSHLTTVTEELSANMGEIMRWMMREKNKPEDEASKVMGDYLVPRDMSVGQFIHILSGRLRLDPGKALFVFVENTLPQTSSLMETVYDSYKDEDGFLYMCYSSEKTFGYGYIQNNEC